MRTCTATTCGWSTIEREALSGENDIPREIVIDQSVVGNLLKGEETPDVHQEYEDDELMENLEDEVAREKLKLFIRLVMEVGCFQTSEITPLKTDICICCNEIIITRTTDSEDSRMQQPSKILEFDIDFVMKERCRIYEHSWSPLNPSEVIADEASSRNPDAKCLCSKLVVCSQSQEDDQPGPSKHATACPWLCSKLIPNRSKDTLPRKNC
ncbi:unnamed protein product [Linum tenue]|uniref:Uncharacterized protein n=1 Tax=Linum tenue TaxID=586396 RepID=A0AAV0RYP4_9ROSI|nr:unnamed protein product [Linum tenue]